MPQRITKQILVIFAFMVLGRGESVAQDTGADADAFHMPATRAEKTLDKILNQSFDDYNMIDFLLRTPDYNGKKSKLYEGYFTKALRDTLAQAERDAVKESCDGQYKEGELCGLDIVPTTCSVDLLDNHVLFYHTEKETPLDAVIAMQATSERIPTPIARYHLIYTGHQWQIDGIHCSNMKGGFNMN